LVLPIPGQDGKFAQDQAQTQGMKWPEPFYFIFDQLNSLPANFDRSSWDKPIDELIKKIENHETHSEIRKIAILRLITIQKINGLTEEELHKFAGALISNKIENTNLPKNVRLFDFRYLRFIDKLQEELRIFLKNWLLETPIIDYYDSNHWWNSNLLVNCIEDLTNKERQFYFDEYCQILTLSSEFLAVKINNRNSQYLTNDDLIKILEKVIDWERKFVNYYNTLSSSPLGVNKYEYYKEYFVWILEIMNKIIYPNVNLNDLNINKIYELSNQVLALLSSVNIEILSALPGMLILGKECLYETKKKLQEGLISSNIETVFQSIEGVLYWTYYSKSIENFPKLDDDLLGGIIDKVYSRKQPILDIAISSLASIIEMYPDLINDEKSNKICSALKYLFEDTEIPILKQYEEAVMDIYKPFDLEDILKYRKVASDLAFSMKEWYESKKFDQKEIISKWEQRSVKDKLPEIRKKWENSQNG
ncbi:MAG: hypothetical protein M1542_09165, partial [Thermotogae bacterium]|nr:hypothetical protein [Thermotogota bacterium]